MKLPNDLIKATDYSKVKDRIIHEFKCVNGKVIQHYALGGQHELTTQEIIDCLNALPTIDCDLQTAYAYIKSQQEKIADLESKLAQEKEFAEQYRKECAKIQTDYYQLKQQLAEKEKEIFFYQNVIKEKSETATEMCELLRPYELKLRENEMYKDRFKNLYNRYNQDKISFAVEKLEWLKEKVYNAKIHKINMINTHELYEILDNQIKQLKEGK